MWFINRLSVVVLEEGCVWVVLLLNLALHCNTSLEFFQALVIRGSQPLAAVVERKKQAFVIQRT